MESIFSEFKKLNSTEQLRLLKLLEAQIVTETRFLSYVNPSEKKNECFYCKGESVIKYGFYSNSYKCRYKCNDCKKTFSDFTETFIYCIMKKDLWMSFINLMLENKSIREIAKQLHLSTKTIFTWRHRVLSSFQDIFQLEFNGIVETDDIFLKFNQKGRENNQKKFSRVLRGISNQQVSVVALADRYKTLDMRVVKLGRITTEDLARVINKDRLNKDNIICSDMHRSIENYVNSIGLKHQQIKASAKEYVREGLYHVNKVNSLASEFKRWVNKNFINVSTKYLQYYLFGFKMNQILKGDEKMEDFIKYSLKDVNTYHRFKQREFNYQHFLNY